MEIINELIKRDKLIKEKISKYKYKRFLFEQIYRERPFKSILGLRGVGKTTLLVQLALDNDGFYISLDDVKLKSINLLELLQDLNEKYNFTYFLLDEIQSLENWSNQLKDIFELSDFDICFSGSSLINILEESVDISRRVKGYQIPPLSFREYLLFNRNKNVDKISFENLLNEKERNKKLLEISSYQRYFKDYLRFGAYPFGTTQIATKDAFENILNKTIYVDFARIKNIDENSLQLALKILRYIAQGTDEISFNSLSNVLGVSKTKVISLFDLLEKSMLIIRIEPKVLGKNLLKKHPKYSMLLPLRALINYIFGVDSQVGNLREDMLINSLFFQKDNLFFLKSQTKQPDFYLKGNIFEVGGNSKTRKQIKEHKNAYLVKESLENNEYTIPLILFGFLY